MTGALAFGALALLVAAACVAASRMPPRRAWIPVAAVALVAGLLGFETARYDLGQPDAFRTLSWFTAPVVAIFCGALWGARRFYGWPDLGPVPGRIAVVAGAILVGVLAGTAQGERDVAASQATAEGLRSGLVAWRDTHEGAWPPDLGGAVLHQHEAPPSSSMGLLAPPPIEYGLLRERRVLSFRVSGGRRRVLDLETGRWSTEVAP